MTEPRRVQAIDLETLPRGKISRLEVTLVTDALGFDVVAPVLVARGDRPGPVLGLTAAVHGNEVNGIAVIHRLFDRIDPRNLRGSVVAVVAVNVPGLHQTQREYVDGTDLNDIMPGRPGGNRSAVYAHRVLERIGKVFDAHVDLHTASFGRVNSLYVRADMTEPMAAEMAYLQRPQIILHNTPSDGTLRGSMAELGVPAITVEIGDPSRFQPSFVKRTLTGLRAVMSEVGLLPRRVRAEGPEPVLCQRSQWLYTDAGGLLEVFPALTDKVEADEVVARLSNAWGDVVREYRAPHSGVVIGKSTNPVGPTGARIIHLGEPAGAEHPFTTRVRAARSLRGRKSKPAGA